MKSAKYRNAAKKYARYKLSTNGQMLDILGLKI